MKEKQCFHFPTVSPLTTDIPSCPNEAKTLMPGKPTATFTPGPGSRPFPGPLLLVRPYQTASPGVFSIFNRECQLNPRQSRQKLHRKIVRNQKEKKKHFQATITFGNSPRFSFVSHCTSSVVLLSGLLSTLDPPQSHYVLLSKCCDASSKYEKKDIHAELLGHQRLLECKTHMTAMSNVQGRVALTTIYCCSSSCNVPTITHLLLLRANNANLPMCTSAQYFDPRVQL